jgi:hypothetical protein
MASTLTGGIFLNYRGWEDRAAEQTVYLTGKPAQVGGWLWQVTCLIASLSQGEIRASLDEPDRKTFGRFFSGACSSSEIPRRRLLAGPETCTGCRTKACVSDSLIFVMYHFSAGFVLFSVMRHRV